MKRGLSVAISALTLIFLQMAVFCPAAGAGGQYAQYLSVADVEKATGLKGLSMKESPITLEFYAAGGAKILEARFDRPSFYDSEVGPNTQYYESVAGVGEKAALGIPQMPYRLVFIKGKYCVMVQTLPGGDGKLPVAKDQLIAIGKIIASRL
jgi:hypothetical protein